MVLAPDEMARRLLLPCGRGSLVRSARPEGIPEPVLLRIAALIEEQSGLALDEIQCRALMRPSCSGWPARIWAIPGLSLATPSPGALRRATDAHRGDRQRETAFFRNAAHFRALRDVVLPALLTEARRVVFWSAGCATGEEAYSLAIACLEAGLPAIAPVLVLGTDINRSALAAAERGEYAERHLANVGPELRERYFEATPHGGRVSDTVRELVSWAPHNLLNPELPLPPESVDILFCQNVTIYFRPETVRRVRSGWRRCAWADTSSRVPRCPGAAPRALSWSVLAIASPIASASARFRRRADRPVMPPGRRKSVERRRRQPPGGRRARLPQSPPEAPPAAVAESEDPPDLDGWSLLARPHRRTWHAPSRRVSAALEADPMRPEAWSSSGCCSGQDAATRRSVDSDVSSTRARVPASFSPGDALPGARADERCAP